jgi:hypothetical protein
MEAETYFSQNSRFASREPNEVRAKYAATAIPSKRDVQFIGLLLSSFSFAKQLLH